MQSMICQCTPVADTQFGEENGESPSTAVVEAIATAEEVAPTELEPLFGEIDLEALDELFADADTTAVLCVETGEWNVFVRGDGAVRVCNPDRQAEPAPPFARQKCDC